MYQMEPYPLKEYKITLTLRTDYHPKKWIADAINDNLNRDYSTHEEIIDLKIEELH